MPRLLARLLLAALALLALGQARAGEALVLDGRRPVYDAWAVLRVLADPGQALRLEDVLPRRAEFAQPAVPRNNFGPRREAMWFLVPLDVRSAEGRWVLELDYPPLNLIDAWLVKDGRVVQRAAMGNLLEAAERPIRGRSHAVALELEDGARYELFVRVVSTSAMVVPIRLHQADEFVRHESARLLLQGLMLGLAAMLLASSLASAISLRDRVFVYYAMMLAGVTMFFVSFSGVGHAFLWSAQVGTLAKISPWGALLALAGASLFVEAALQIRVARPRLARVLRGAAVAGLAAIALSALGVLDYRATQLAATMLGPIPVVLGLHESLRQAREGSRSARFLVLGWAAYTVGALSMAAQLRGWLPVNFWTQHLFQFASIVEMFAWMQVLALRVENIRREAQRAQAERQVLHSLAHTDALTGLPNRRGLALALEGALPRARAGQALALYLLDLDGFKAVNDRLGHDAGDELLVQVSRRLRGVLRGADVVARLGGDEFVVMTLGVGSEAAAFAVGQKMLDAFAEPFAVGGEACRVGLTIGFALAPQDGTEAGELLHRADAAMYAGKQGGRHCVRRGGAAAGLARA